MAKEKYPDIPVFLMGHNMGSFLLRTYIVDNSHKIDGVLLSGTGSFSMLQLNIIIFLTNINILFKGYKNRSKMMYEYIFRKYKNGYKNDSQWLSHNQKEMDKYNADPYCGGIMSNCLYKSFALGLKHMNRSNASKVRKDLPLCFLSGTGDSVGKINVVEKVADKYTALGVENIELKFYDGKRHDILNELNQVEVFDDIYQWQSKVMENVKDKVS
jgi:alpha-beta hydrolase superfamily lysophospholipase